MDLTKGSIWQLLRKVTIPASTGSLFQTFYNLVDTYFAGRISPEALAAIAKSFPVFFIIIATGVGLGVASTALMANSIGEGNKNQASFYLAQAITFAIALSISCKIGDVTMDEHDVAANAMAIINNLKGKLPNGDKNIRRYMIKTTMGKAIKLDHKVK